MLYQMLQQMTRPIDLANIPSTYEETSDFTPSLAALDDVQALMKKDGIEMNLVRNIKAIPYPSWIFDFNPARTGLHEDGLYPKYYP